MFTRYHSSLNAVVCSVLGAASLAVSGCSEKRSPHHSLDLDAVAAELVHPTQIAPDVALIEKIEQWQRLLSERGLLDGSQVTGEWNDATEGAVHRLHDLAGIHEPVHSVSRRTLELLSKISFDGTTIDPSPIVPTPLILSTISDTEKQSITRMLDSIRGGAALSDAGSPEERALLLRFICEVSQNAAQELIAELRARSLELEERKKQMLDEARTAGPTQLNALVTKVEGAIIEAKRNEKWRESIEKASDHLAKAVKEMKKDSNKEPLSLISALNHARCALSREREPKKIKMFDSAALAALELVAPAVRHLSNDDYGSVTERLRTRLAE